MVGERATTHADDRAAHKSEGRRRAEFEVAHMKMKRRRSLLGLLGFIPLVTWLLAESGVPPFVLVPRDIYLLVWAAVLGSYLGLTFRMWRARRDFTRANAA